jgi:hypothetical protein
MQLSPIHQLIYLLGNSLAQLNCAITPAETEKIGIFIFLAMEGSQRKFHNSNHVLDICKDMTPLQTLSGLFHDVVYYQIDGGFPPNSDVLLLPFVEVKSEGIFIRKDIAKHQIFDSCLTIFGFQQGQKLENFGGQNEFLSALLGALLLENHVNIKLLAAFFVCIEATIPFRKPNSQNQTSYQSSYQKAEKNLQILAQEYNFELPVTEIDEIIKQSLGLANRDVANFAAADVGKFLDGTWTLLPESHAQLWYGGVYSVQSYRIALSKMEHFLNILQPEVIFEQYKGFPDDITFKKLEAQATKNIAISRQYIGVKLLPIAIIEAAALLTGGDAPLSFFMGDVRMHEQDIKRAEDFLPQLLDIHKDIDYDVFRLLEFGRTTATSFDLQNSPLASFIYKKIGENACIEILKVAKSFFTQQISPQQFLQDINDYEVSNDIIMACAKIAETRTEKLLGLMIH